MRRKPAWLCACLVMLALQSCARSKDVPLTGFEADFENEAKTWREIEVQIPPYPKPENLLKIPTGSATPHQFYVDAPSVAVGSDGVTRYTVQARTQGGATNVTYEGMRCETRERKIYAFGHANGTWTRARDAQWQRVILRDLTPYSHTLFTQFFCNERTRPTPAKVAIDALQQGRGLAPGSGTDD